ncbi:MAG: LapA family protein [Pseudolabrys sp.]
MRGVTSQLESENQEAMTTKSKLILGGILILFGIIFAMQNSTVVQVRFLIWSVQMSQALVIFLTGAVGTIIGFLFSTAFKISRQS